MEQPQLRVFPGGGKATIIDRGESDTRKRFRIEWPNASTEQRQEIEAFVNGPADSWQFSHAGDFYGSCNLEPDSLRIEPATVEGWHRVVLTFRADHCLVCGAESARLYNRDLSFNLVSIDCPDCGGNFRIIATMQPSTFDHRRSELRAMLKEHPEEVIGNEWEIRLAQLSRPKPNY
jgi:hypothetical protein